MTAAAPALPVAPPPAATGRNRYIDTLRGIAIFGVVCIHFGGSFATSANAWSSSFHLGLFLNQAFSFAVPLFVFLAGLMAGSRRVQNTSELMHYYRRRFTRVVVPYLLASAAAFYFLGHLAEWNALPGTAERVKWLAGRLIYGGIEPTFYFIPMILLLYVVQPALQALPRWLARFARWEETTATYVLTGLFFALHVALAVLCYRNVLSYYSWARPCPLFWLFFFFSGLHWSSLIAPCPPRLLIRFVYVAALVAIGALAVDLIQLNDRQRVGDHFQHNGVDYAYVRPVLVVFDLAVFLVLAAGVHLGWPWKSRLLELFGRRSLEIYLWHILVLYEIAWRFASALAWCRELPELIVLVALIGSGLIVSTWEVGGWLFAQVRQYRDARRAGIPVRG